MPLTSDQSATALRTLIQNIGNDAVLDSFVPGLSTDTLIAGLVTALNGAYDDELTTCLGSLVVQTQATIDATQAALGEMQKQIDSVTVAVNPVPLPPTPAPAPLT